MTLAETLSHISDSEGYDQRAALAELRKVLADGLFRQFQMRWADSVPIPIGSSPIAVTKDTPVWVDWGKAKFRLRGDGAVLDDWTGYRRTKPRWRKLWLLKERVENQWPPKTKNRPLREFGLFSSAKRRGPASAKQTIVEAASRLIEKGRTPINCGTWEAFRRELCREIRVPPNSRGYQLDTIQNAVRPLLKERSSSTAERTDNTES
jgi:hypothetical protein